MKDLAIVIVSYNTKELTRLCLEHVYRSVRKKNSTVEVVIYDNASSDGSVEALKKIRDPKIPTKIIASSKNLGFSKANNEAFESTKAKYILFLNSDAFVKDVNFDDLLYYMNKNPDVGALTIKVELENGKIDPASHRGIPTVWRSFAYFSKLERVFKPVPKLSKLFGGYHLSHLDLDTIHEIESPSGAFYLTRSQIFKKIHGFDSRFFMYGEDLDLSERIKKEGYKIMYFPLFRVVHLKHKSGIKRDNVQARSATKYHFYNAMKLFYDKHYGNKNSTIVNKLVHLFISIKSKI